MEMRIIVTGGLGFIGSNLIRLIINKSHFKKIIIVDNLSKSNLAYLKSITKFRYHESTDKYKGTNDRVSVIKADIKNYSFAKKITKGIDAVIHLAAESGIDVSIRYPRKSFNVNIVGTYNYLESCRLNNVGHFIFASSGSVYGNAVPPMRENTIKNPISTYGSSKLSIESFCETYSKIFKLKTSILRFSNAYGPYSSHKKSVVANFIKNIIDNKDLNINGDGSITRDYIYSEDIAKAIINCLGHSKNFIDFNIATGKETSLNGLIKSLITISREQKYNNINLKYGKERLGDMKSNSMSPYKYRKCFKVKKFTTINDGLKSTFKWFIKNYE